MTTSFGCGGSALSGLAQLRNARSKRISSYDVTGANRDSWRIEPGEKKNLAEITGAGAIRHIWFTVWCEDAEYLRKVLLRIYWDGEKNPSVETPVGDFFGVGFAKANHFWSLPLNMIRKEGWGKEAGMNCFFPMPFAENAIVQVENQSEKPVGAFYFYVDYEQYDKLDDDLARFHAQWRRENPCQAVVYGKQPGQQESDSGGEYNLTGDENYVILEAEGRGHYVGCVVSVDNLNVFHQNYAWFGEGDDMMFIDGEKWPPSLHGTGTEDYFCAAWGFPGYYCTPYHGISLCQDPTDFAGRTTMYRFHIEDPVHFQKSIRVTIEHGHANDQGNDYSSVGYWYQTEPHKPFPPMLPVSKRVPNR